MEAKELITKIQILKKVQPDRKWALATKSQITGKPQYGLAFDLIFNRTLLLAPAMIAILLAGIFFYNKSIVKPEMAAMTPEMIRAITTGLRTVETDVIKVADNIGQVKEPKKVLEIKPTIDSTLENGERIVMQFRKFIQEPNQKSSEVLATLVKVETALTDMEKTYVSKQAELAGQLIEELESRELTAEQATLLEEAKRYYDEGNFSEALIKALEVSQTR